MATAAGLGAVGAAKSVAFGRRAMPGVELRYPGMAEGHAMRDMKQPPAPSEFIDTDVVIVGSGAAALSCAWQLRKLGQANFLMLEGPRPMGNCAFGQNSYSRYPQAAHYLPVPPRSCTHVREMLHEFGILQEGIDAERPRYDERALVHAPAERLLGRDGKWHAGLVPPMADGSPAAGQWARFQAELARLRALTNAQGRAAFVLPQSLGASLAGASLDTLSFAQWLARLGVVDADLRWYFDYCCRDEYGAPAAVVSAWAGVHYFIARGGYAENADDGAVLTWPEGLGYLARRLGQSVLPAQRLALSVLSVRRRAGGVGGVDVLALDTRTMRTIAIKANRAVVATPLATARRIVREDFADLREEAGPAIAPWLVANFTLSRFPLEKEGTPLAWDNVVLGSESLGFVNATHQLVRVARPAGTVLTAYHALGGADSKAARQALAHASAESLLATAAQDLDRAYGEDWRQWVVSAELTVHGHAMATPTVGFLADKVRSRAAAATGAISYAHSDLAGYSVFEEAAWWGTRAARLASG
jgi:hypothetical protein